MGLGNAYTQPLGYIIVWVQVDGVQGYNEDQIALVIPYLSNFAERIPVILGTPTISCIVNVMNWVNARVAHLFSVHRAAVPVVGNENMEASSSNGYDEVVVTKNAKTIDAFSSCIMPVRTEEAYMGECINIMTQALQTEDGSLPQGLTVQNAYTELRQGSKNSVMMVRNSMAYPQTLQKRTPVAMIMVPKPQESPVCGSVKTGLRILIHLN